MRIFGDVAYEGGLYSPSKRRSVFEEDDVDEEDMRFGIIREESPQEIQDEELLYYDR